MKDKMTRWFRYTAEDVKAAQAELDELADQGWELAELGIFTATFRWAERPRRCWVEPARWTSIRRKDEQARSDYLALCDEAGWDLLDEAGGMFYFQAKPDTDPAPIQTDGSLEWEEVLKKSLWNQAYTFFCLVVYWIAWAAGRFFLDQPRVWEMFFSNGAMLAQLFLLAWIALELFLGFRVVRYRKKCRRAAEAGKPIPVPRRGAARFRGAMPLVSTVLVIILLLSILGAFSSERSNHEVNGRLTAERSVLGESVEYREFSEKGDLWIESYDCKASWLAGIVCGDLRAIEGDENRLHRYFHYHGTVELTEADLGYDKAWIYAWDGGNGLIIRQGNRVIHMEAEKLDLTDRTVVEEQLVWLEQAACTLT
ncbi:DUF2812 domain-containing protein [Flavonifractor sp. HCP28S3_F3]|uniref:DUF2812 domain-containing protein n=1 Tax=Flavonifractor sp. HCP28S3_F3 TaxID=3438939 RepID=UPI003F89016F